jgi:hypothetical protein
MSEECHFSQVLIAMFDFLRVYYKGKEKVMETCINTVESIHYFLSDYETNMDGVGMMLHYIHSAIKQEIINNMFTDEDLEEHILIYNGFNSDLNMLKFSSNKFKRYKSFYEDILIKLEVYNSTNSGKMMNKRVRKEQTALKGVRIVVLDKSKYEISQACSFGINGGLI